MIEETRKSSFKAKVLAYAIRGLLSILHRTCSIQISGGENLLNSAKNGACIIALWHNRLALIGPAALGVGPKLTFTAFVSNSKDGDIMAEYTTSHSNGRTIRVPHDNKERALKTMISRLKMKREVLIVTPDGPRGPRYEPKPGIILAAKEANALIVPLSWDCDKYWELSSWDRFRIPKPFAKINITFGEPLKIAPETDVDEDLQRLKKALPA